MQERSRWAPGSLAPEERQWIDARGPVCGQPGSASDHDNDKEDYGWLSRRVQQVYTEEDVTNRTSTGEGSRVAYLAAGSACRAACN
jgi:hypothetical protein